MSTRIPYTYTVLRYVHDVTTGEFINVGVVVSSPEDGFISARFKSAYTRVKRAFPTLRGEDFTSRIQTLQSRFDSIQIEPSGQIPPGSGRRLTQIIHEILPADDSALQWSPVGSGLSRDLRATVTSLFKRFVTKYDSEHQTSRRNDDDVWKDFKVALEKRNLTKHLTPKTIEVEDDGVRFEHAWKNGVWHCYEPLSFDLASKNSIKGKAHKWLGQLASLQDSKEDFSVYFLVGKPREKDLETSYEQALGILRKGRGVNVVEESQIAQFLDQVAETIATCHTLDDQKASGGKDGNGSHTNLP